jgi:hypothetical protein
MKKEPIPECKGLITKTCDEKRGNPKMHKGIKIEGDFTNRKPRTVS